MANITENRVDTMIAAPDIAAANASINTLQALLPGGGLTLTDEERLRYRSINVDNKVQVEEVISEMGVSGANVLPGYLTVAKLQNDLGLYNQLDTLESGVNGVLQRIRDLKRIAAHEAISNADAVYNLYKIAALAGIPGAQTGYDRLKQRYEGQGGGQQQANP